MKKPFTLLRLLFAANILFAGIPGSLMILFPSWAKTIMYTWPVDDFLFGITGSIWLAIGLVSTVGLKYPLQIAPLLLLQISYKTIWILFVGIPLGNSGLIDAWYYVGGFTLMVTVFTAAFPFRSVFSPIQARSVVQ